MEFAVTAPWADDSYGCDRPEGVVLCLRRSFGPLCRLPPPSDNPKRGVREARSEPSAQTKTSPAPFTDYIAPNLRPLRPKVM